VGAGELDCEEGITAEVEWVVAGTDRLAAIGEGPATPEEPKALRGEGTGGGADCVPPRAAAKLVPDDTAGFLRTRVFGVPVNEFLALSTARQLSRICLFLVFLDFGAEEQNGHAVSGTLLITFARKSDSSFSDVVEASCF
jgi:hypothetical protein